MKVLKVNNLTTQMSYTWSKFQLKRSLLLAFPCNKTRRSKIYRKDMILLSKYIIIKSNMKIKRILTIISLAIIIASILSFSINTYAFAMGGTSIYNSSGSQIGIGDLWNSYNDLYTLNGGLESNLASTLTIVLKPKGIDLKTGEEVVIAISPHSLSDTKYTEHSYTVDKSRYYPTLAAATFMIAGTYSSDYSYKNGWNWG